MEAVQPSLALNGGAVISLGGCGENGRNCFLFTSDRGNLLLDCGVKRELGNPSEIYPALTPRIAASLDMVLLTHCHEDHCAALPLLYAMGYSGCVYASEETIHAAPAMMRKWMKYCREHGVALPYEDAHVQAVRFSALQHGQNTLGAFCILAGRSGHTVGSFWYAIGWDTREPWPLFYSGDMCLCSATLTVDMPPRCQAAVLNSAYAAGTLKQAEQYRTLQRIAETIVAQNGHLLLPVPSQGRGCDMLLHLARCFRHIPIWAEESILESLQNLLTQSVWIRRDLPSTSLEHVRCVRTQNQRERSCDAPYGIYLTTDGMLTTAEAHYYLQRFAKDEANGVVISGYAAPGTPAALLTDSAWREKNRVMLQTFRSIIKVHLDYADVLEVSRVLGTRQIMLFHAPQEKCCALMSAIRRAEW